MEKRELFLLLESLYKIASQLGTRAEEEYGENYLLNDAYDNISKCLDSLEELGYNKNWIDRSTNERIK